MQQKFQEGDQVSANVVWSNVKAAFVQKSGARQRKDKKGRDVFETFTYMVKDVNGKLHYFFEGELSHD